MKKSLIFDFDGVIADTRDVLFSIFSEMDPETSDEDFLAHFDGNVHEEPRVKFTPESLAHMHSEYRRRLKPRHVYSAVDRLKLFALDYRLFIVSSGDEQAIKSVLHAVGVQNCFEAIYGHNTHTSKVAKFEMIRDQTDVLLDDTFFITDTLGDIKEANTLGLRTIAVSFGFHDRLRLIIGSPYAIVGSWGELQSVIEQQSIHTGQK